MKAVIIITITITIGSGMVPIINRNLRASTGVLTLKFANQPIIV